MVGGTSQVPELCSELSAPPIDPRLHGADGDAEHVRNRLEGQPFEIDQNHRGPELFADVL